MDYAIGITTIGAVVWFVYEFGMYSWKRVNKKTAACASKEGSDVKMNTESTLVPDSAWILNMAEREDNGVISAGGVVCAYVKAFGGWEQVVKPIDDADVKALGIWDQSVKPVDDVVEAAQVEDVAVVGTPQESLDDARPMESSHDVVEPEPMAEEETSYKSVPAKVVSKQVKVKLNKDKKSPASEALNE